MRRTVATLAGIVILWGKRRFKWTQPHWLFAVACCLFGALWVGVVGAQTLSADSDALTAYQKGDYQTVAGVVTDFHPTPYEGHQEECFSVQEQRFCYSDYVIAPGFHNAASHGGPIRAGLPVRIAYWNGSYCSCEPASVAGAYGERSLSAEDDHCLPVHNDLLDAVVEPPMEAGHAVLA